VLLAAPVREIVARPTTEVPPAWSRDPVSFRAVLLGDGAASWDKPYKAPDGQTYSVAVALDVPA
jgi:hypothetical protein